MIFPPGRPYPCGNCGSVIPVGGQVVVAPTPDGPEAACSEDCEAAIWVRHHPKTPAS